MATLQVQHVVTAPPGYDLSRLIKHRLHGHPRRKEVSRLAYRARWVARRLGISQGEGLRETNADGTIRCYWCARPRATGFLLCRVIFFRADSPSAHFPARCAPLLSTHFALDAT